jgi:hypothetical protein
MEKQMTLDEYVSTIRYFRSLSHDEKLSALARRTLSEHADAMLKSYRVDDTSAVLVRLAVGVEK